MTQSAVVLCDDHEIVREAIKARMASSSIARDRRRGRQRPRRRRRRQGARARRPDHRRRAARNATGSRRPRRCSRSGRGPKSSSSPPTPSPTCWRWRLRAGASGYVLKSAPAEDIARAVKAVTGGGTFLGGDFAGGKPSEVEKLLELSPRERADPRAARRGAAGQRDRRAAAARARRPSTPTCATRSPSSRSTPAPRRSRWPCGSATSALRRQGSVGAQPRRAPGRSR